MTNAIAIVISFAALAVLAFLIMLIRAAFEQVPRVLEERWSRPGPVDNSVNRGTPPEVLRHPGGAGFAFKPGARFAPLAPRDSVIRATGHRLGRFADENRRGGRS